MKRMHIHFRSSFIKKKCQWWGHSDVELVPGFLSHCQSIKRRSLDSLPKTRCPSFIIFQLCTQMLANSHGQNDGSGIGKTTDVYWRTTKGINLWFLNAQHWVQTFRRRMWTCTSWGLSLYLCSTLSGQNRKASAYFYCSL